MWGRPINWRTARIWALATGGADEPGVIWCGTLPGGLFRSTDHGQSWQILRALWDHPKRKQWMGGGADLPGIHSICVDPRNSRRVSIAVSTGGIWFTENTGESWTLRGKGMRAEYAPPEQTHDPITQDVHCLVQCRAAPERMWVQHHNGIFASSDESQTFTEITEVEPSTFGFAVAVTPGRLLRRMLARVALRTSIGSRRISAPFSSSKSKAKTGDSGDSRPTLLFMVGEERRHSATCWRNIIVRSGAVHLGFVYMSQCCSYERRQGAVRGWN